MKWCTALLFIAWLRYIYGKNTDSNEYCYEKIRCSSNLNNRDVRYILYDVNPAEGFNLRRDVYIRFAIFVHNLRTIEKVSNWQLVLPPWFHLHHWKRHVAGPFAWSNFFDLDSLKRFIPVIELQDLFGPLQEKVPFVDRIYALRNFEDAFENGEFVEKWKSIDTCQVKTSFWGYTNITYGVIECFEFFGGASKLSELLALHPLDETVLFTDAQIAVHEHYNDKLYWTARKSMKFSNFLIDIALEYIKLHLNCDKVKCDNYVGVHWRRGDFAKSRKKDVPSLMGTFVEINTLCKNLNILRVFISTDASQNELKKLKTWLKDHSFEVYHFVPKEEDNLNDGQVAIVDQIICSHSAYFIGTHESTFSFRIQEEREIFGFDSESTFNRLCPDSGPCEKPSKWTIVN